MTAINDMDRIVAQMPRLMRTLGRLHLHGSRVLVEDFGKEGQGSLRQWIRRYATWRGHELRKAHMALGIPINVESLMRNWDNAVTYHLMDEWNREGSWSPHSVKVSVKEGPGACPVSEPWVEADYYRWGHVYCDELHQNIVQAYHPEAAVVIPQCMQKREPVCNFHWLMPPTASQDLEQIPPYPGQDVLKDWQSSSDQEAVMGTVRRATRILAVMVHYLREVLNEFHPPQAEKAFTGIMDLWAADRGAALRREREENGWRAGPKDLFVNYDHPYGVAWKTKQKETSDGIEIEVSYCPFAETWGWMGSLSAMKPYCDRCYAGVVKSYDDSLCAEVSRAKTGGDDTCLIRIMKE